MTPEDALPKNGLEVEDSHPLTEEEQDIRVVVDAYHQHVWDGGPINPEEFVVEFLPSAVDAVERLHVVRTLHRLGEGQVAGATAQQPAGGIKRLNDRNILLRSHEDATHGETGNVSSKGWRTDHRRTAVSALPERNPLRSTRWRRVAAILVSVLVIGGASAGWYVSHLRTQAMEQADQITALTSEKAAAEAQAVAAEAQLKAEQTRATKLELILAAYERAMNKPTIVEPVATDIVPPIFVVRGYIAQNEPGHLWLAVRPARGDRLWPNRPLNVHQGRWEAQIEHHDEKKEAFALVLIRVDDADHKRIVDWQEECRKTMKYPGLARKELPSLQSIVEVTDLKPATGDK